MSADDLIAVPGKRRYIAFGEQAPVITWATFDALQANHMGVAPAASVADEGRVNICFD